MKAKDSHQSKDNGEECEGETTQQEGQCHGQASQGEKAKGRLYGHGCFLPTVQQLPKHRVFFVLVPGCSFVTCSFLLGLRPQQDQSLGFQQWLNNEHTSRSGAVLSAFQGPALVTQR